MNRHYDSRQLFCPDKPAYGYISNLLLRLFIQYPLRPREKQVRSYRFYFFKNTNSTLRQQRIFKMRIAVENVSAAFFKNVIITYPKS
jgi:hypothetical protein